MSGRFWQVMFGFFLLLIGLSSVFGDQALTLMLGLAGFYLITRQFSRANAQNRGDPRARTERARQVGHPMNVEADLRADDRLIPNSRVPIPETDALPHAANAARRAGIDPKTAMVMPVDVGVMAFAEDGTPTLHRTSDIDEDSDAIQPYIHLRLPRRAEGRIRFELIDAARQTAFVHEDRYPLNAGVNLISPRARLPITPQHALRGAWELHIYADDVLIASHTFGWYEDNNKVIRQHLEQDGEISPELRALMAENRLGALSLDELLNDQPPPDEAARGRSS
jgi:hypothetical protein